MLSLELDIWSDVNTAVGLIQPAVNSWQRPNLQEKAWCTAHFE